MVYINNFIEQKVYFIMIIQSLMKQFFFFFFFRLEQNVWKWVLNISYIYLFIGVGDFDKKKLEYILFII